MWSAAVYFLLLSSWNFVHSQDASEDESNTEDDYYSVPGEPTEDCTCVPYYQCENGKIVDDGSGIIDPRKKPQQEELPLSGQFTPPSCGPFHVCCLAPGEATVKPYEHRCGVRNPSGINSRILSPQGDEEAAFGEWPWQAAVLKTEGTKHIFKCGGTLIDKRHVLTVAHCVDTFLPTPEKLTVRLGEWDTQTKTEFMEHEDFVVEKIDLHPEYRKSNLWNDLAILTLEKEVSFKPHIDTACLPREGESHVGQECVVTGWGTNAYKSGTYSNVMKEVAMPVISNERCEELLRKTRLGRHFKLHKGFICAGGEEGKDSCKGDGGGPLVCYRTEDQSYTVVGLVAWGIDCGQPGVPGVYVNVLKYTDWITDITGIPIQDYWSKP